MRDTPLTTTKPQITVTYMRTATTDRRVACLSLERQHQACRDYADALGLRVIAVYCDIGVSGLAEHRPAHDRLMHGLWEGRIRGHAADASSPCDSSQLLIEGSDDDTARD